MVTGTFSYKHNVQCLKTIQMLVKLYRNSLKLEIGMNNVVSMGKNFALTQLSMCHVGCVRFPGYCGQMYSAMFFLVKGCVW